MILITRYLIIKYFPVRGVLSASLAMFQESQRPFSFPSQNSFISLSIPHLYFFPSQLPTSDTNDL